MNMPEQFFFQVVELAPGAYWVEADKGVGATTDPTKATRVSGDDWKRQVRPSFPDSKTQIIEVEWRVRG